MQKVLLTACFSFIMSIAFSQKPAKYNYAAQQKLIPAELGQIFMGMDLKSFAQKINIDSAEIDERFQELRIERIPFIKGNIQMIHVKFMGLSDEQKSTLVKNVMVTRGSGTDRYETEVKRISASAVIAAGQLYEIRIVFKPGFDLAKYVTNTFGKTSDIHKDGDDYYIYDMQWVKKSADGLSMLIRYYKESSSIMLAGRLVGSEWAPL